MISKIILKFRKMSGENGHEQWQRQAVEEFLAEADENEKAKVRDNAAYLVALFKTVKYYKIFEKILKLKRRLT